MGRLCGASLNAELLFYVRQQPCRAILDQVEYMFETLPSPVIWIGHVATPVFCAEVKKHGYLLYVFRRCVHFKDRQMVTIHCQQVIELDEIGSTEPTCPQPAQVVTPARCGKHTSPVRLFAHVIVVRARRINNDPVVKFFQQHVMAKHTFCCR